MLLTLCKKPLVSKGTVVNHPSSFVVTQGACVATRCMLLLLLLLVACFARHFLSIGYGPTPSKQSVAAYNSWLSGSVLL